VVTTTDPPFRLPGAPGIYTFSMSEMRFKCCKVKAGDVVSLDARGGEQAVYGRVPGSVTNRAARRWVMPHLGAFQ
jgi:hypothetical protein